MLLIGHGSAGGDPSCNSCRSCAPQCRDIDNEEAFFDVEGCWFDALELQYPSDTCGIIATLHPDGQEYYAGARRRRADPRDGFLFASGRVRCEATSDGDGAATRIVCTDTCPMPGEDLSCTGTLRLRDAPLGEPMGAAEIPLCPMPDVGLPDLGMPDAFDASVDAEADAMTDAEIDAEVDAAADAELDAAMDLDAGDAGVDAL